MPAPKKASNITAELEALKAKRQKLQVKMDGLRDELDEVRAKLSEVDSAIFEREDGRLLRAVKRIIEDNDPQMAEFNKLVRSFIERELLDDTTPKGIKVKPIKVSANGPIAQAVAANAAKAATATK